MSTHTPGPWVAMGTKALGLSEVVAEGLDFSEGFLVCTINRDWYDAGSQLRPLQRERVDANARLIAAAPELLEACHHAARSEHHAACKCHGEYSGNPEMYCTCHVQKARDAIAKAEGREV